MTMEQVIEIYGKRVKIVEDYIDDCRGCAFADIGCCHGAGTPLLCADANKETNRKFIKLEV